jgi:hypothetical protein
VKEIAKAVALAAASVVGIFAASQVLQRVDVDALEARARRVLARERYANWVDRVWRRERGAVVWEAMEATRAAAEGTT